MADNEPRSESLAHLTQLGGLPAELRESGGMQKLDWVLSRPNVADYVEGLATTELYFLINDVGLHDSYALLEFASVEQVRGILALDTWHKDEPKTDRWLALLDAASSVDFETSQKFIRSTEDEFFEHLLLGEIAVHGKDLDVDAVPDTYQVIRTPDFMYWLVVPRGHELEDRLPALLKLMWATDTDRMRKIFQQIRFDLPAPVLSYLQRFRAGHLQDMGFEAPEDVLSLWSILQVEPAKAALLARLDEDADEAYVSSFSTGEMLQGLALRDVAPPLMLRQALARLDDVDRSRFGEGLGFLVNRTFQALNDDLSRTDDLPVAGKHAVGLLNLGLEFAADGDVDRAAGLLKTAYPLELFKLGHSLTREVAVSARALEKRTGVGHGLSLLGSPLDEAVHGAGLVQPLYFAALDDGHSLHYRPFATMADLQRVRGVVADADAVVSFFETRFGLTIDALIEVTATATSAADEVRLATLFRTGLAHAVVEESFAFAPLDREQLSLFARVSLTPESGLSPTVDNIVEGFKAQAEPEVARFIEQALAALVTAIGGVSADDIEPRYLGELFLTSGR